MDCPIVPAICAALLFDPSAYSAVVVHKIFLSFLYFFRLTAVKYFALLNTIARSGANGGLIFFATNFCTTSAVSRTASLLGATL